MKFDSCVLVHFYQIWLMCYQQHDQGHVILRSRDSLILPLHVCADLEMTWRWSCRRQCLIVCILFMSVAYCSDTNNTTVLTVSPLYFYLSFQLSCSINSTKGKSHLHFTRHNYGWLINTIFRLLKKIENIASLMECWKYSSFLEKMWINLFFFPPKPLNFFSMYTEGSSIVHDIEPLCLMIEYYHKCIIVRALSCLFMYEGQTKFTAFLKKLCQMSLLFSKMLL